VASDPPPDTQPEVTDMASGETRSSIQGASARERLRPRGRAVALWAVFYPDWYAQTYPDPVRAAAPGFREILLRYLDHGQAAGHSPNPLFDEAWYRAAYPHVAAAIASGQVQSGFDQYCRAGFRDHSPHWLFDEQYYRRCYPGLTDETLAARGAANGYAHYLRIGDREGRSGSPFFDPTIYRANASAEAAAMIDAEGAFLAFLHQSGTDPVERRTTLYFDPDWYRAAYPDVAEAIEAGRWHGALHHYLANTTPTAFDPLPVFSERDYLARHPDIAEAIEAGKWRNGYTHFLANGSAELRSPSASLDLRWYVENNASVRADIAAGRAPDAFAHYLAIGHGAGLPSAPPPEVATTASPTEPKDPFAALFLARARALLPTIARAGLNFTCAGPPSVAVIMLLRDAFAVTLQSLAALRDRHRGDIELILVDCASNDEGRHILRYVRGARLVRFDTPIQPAVARNAALRAVTAPAVLLLGNRTEVAHGATDAALRRMNGDERIAAVGGKVLGQDGRLREAGGITWRDGTLQTYLCGGSPLAPEANFVRDVDFCSIAFLLIRSTLLQDLDGFDETFLRPDYAAADLCVRVVGAGYRVVYDPSVSTHRLDGPATGTPATGAGESSEAQAFVRKHIDHLRARELADPKVEVFARDVGTRHKRVLYIEDLVPLRRIGSGFVRSNDLIRVMASMGVFVTVYPVNPSDFDPAAIYADLPDTVEVMHERSLADFDAFLAEREDYYDFVWVARTHNLDRILPWLTRGATGAGRPPRVVLDTEAIAALREAAQQRLSRPEETFDLDSAVRQEFANAHICQNITAVNEQEAAILRPLGFSDAVVVGHIRDLAPTPRDFAERSGLLFVGAIHEVNSPNYDGLCWFVDEVLPLVEQELGWETRLHIVGYTGAGVSLDRFGNHPRVTLRGAVAETEPLYNAHRVFIAPTRYAAGTPYKIYEAASFGVPVVATELLRQQMGWEDGKELLAADSADPAQFARHVVTLYRDPALWQALRDNALARLAAENGREHYVQALTTILGL
jgi:glycosyltransferase involved in cell wall biosynthesis